MNNITNEPVLCKKSCLAMEKCSVCFGSTPSGLPGKAVNSMGIFFLLRDPETSVI